ncbi:MAG: zinc ABC transporter ATP-binding protein [Clostridiales bacterium]|nr:MAG: zinc ABC transporter ATP-binding protein [Clostridiales bacterium]
MQRELVTVKDAVFAYQTQRVLNGANLSICKGDYLGLIGPNGSSKSTLLKLMLGVLKLQGGSITLFDAPVDQFCDWGKIGYVAQNANQVNQAFPATVEEIVKIGLYPNLGWLKRTTDAHRKRVAEVLDIVEMSHLKHRLIGNLSGGQRQKVFIARALVSSPEIIFLDEPTVGIDAASQIKFYDLLDKLNAHMGVTIVMVSHDIGIVSEKVTKIACMENGRVYMHDACCALPVATFIEQFYGDKMHLMKHHHHTVQLERG